MAGVSNDILVAYPIVDGHRAQRLAALARRVTVRVAIDSDRAAATLAEAAKSAGSTIGILIDLDVGNHRTGLSSAERSLRLAKAVSRTPGLRLDGLFYYPGHIGGSPADQADQLDRVRVQLEEALELWRGAGLEAAIVSGGSTPTARQSHLVPMTTEIRPGTYIFNDLYEARGGYCRLEDCAARFHCTVVSDAVHDQIILDAGSKTLSSDRCGTAPDSGFGFLVECPEAKVVKLSEEHAQVDVSRCDRCPAVGSRVTLIPNHICVAVNLVGRFWWRENGDAEMVESEARAMVV